MKLITNRQKQSANALNNRFNETQAMKHKQWFIIKDELL